ncbi:MAG: aminotransferase class V-fold PLP-dependent enzyme [Candidatus Micrarchaeota archaeon]|nr:aminotransferase class V-fold PLP-dependent enzyme [Candidatus Micrarchaeota archaeon]
MDAQRLREDFPALAANPGLAYFDNACTTLKPKTVIGAVNDYYSKYPACAGRSNHRLSRQVDESLHVAREAVSKFIQCAPDHLLWTRNTTEGLNAVIAGLDYSKRPKVVTSVLEHHSLLLPLQRLAAEGKIQLHFAEPDAQGLLSADSFAALIDKSTALVAAHHTSNTTGARAPLKEITKAAHDAGARVLVDGAQAVPHCAVRFKDEGYDFMAFSGHKMLGPTGIGALAARPEALREMRPLLIGGETIRVATLRTNEPLPAPERYEAGIQHYSGILGLAAATAYLQKVGPANIEKHELALAAKVEQAVLACGGKLYGPKAAQKSSGLVAFNLPGIPAHQTAALLDKASGIAVRSGYFCAQPACEFLGAKEGAARASLYLYNTGEEVEKFAKALEQIKQLS